MSLKKSLLKSEQQTKVVTNAGLSYFAQQFNKVVEGKIGTVAANLGDVTSDLEGVKVDLGAHIRNQEVHITTEERQKWNDYQNELEALEKLITGKSAVEVVANLDALQNIADPKVGDLVYVLSTEGHPEGGAGQALGFIYANIDGQAGWHLFTDLEPSLHAKDLTVDAIAGIEGTTVQAVLESLATKIAGEVARLEGLITAVDTKVDTTKTELVEKIAGVEAKVDAEITDREAGDRALQEAINTVDGKVIDLQGQLGSDKGELEAKIQEVQANVEAETVAREEAINEVKGLVNTLEQKVDGEVVKLGTEITTLKEKDAFLEGEIARVEGEMALLAGRVEANEQDIDALQTETEAIKDRIDALEAQVGEDLQKKINDLRDELTALITALDTRVTALENKAVVVDGRLDDVEGQVTTIEDKLAGIQEGAEVNQNAFSKITVGGVEVTATEKEDTFELAVDPGLLIKAEGKKITVSLDIIENSEIDDIIGALTPSRR